MKSTFGKQVINGIVGLLLTIGVFTSFITVFHVTNKWSIDILIAIAMPCFFGSLMCIFGGKDMFFYGAKLGLGMVVFIVLSTELPNPYKGIFVTMCAIAAFAVPVVKEYLYDREKNSTSHKNKKLAKKIKEKEEFEQLIEVENSELLTSIAFGEKSLLLKSIHGGFYQCIKGEDKFYFNYVGSELSWVDLDLIVTDFSREDLFVSKKKDYAISKKDIYSIKYDENKYLNSQICNSGGIVIESRQGNKKFLVMDKISLEAMNEFFYGIKINEKWKKLHEKRKNPIIDKEEKKPDKELVARLKLLCTILTVISVAASAVFLFLITNYKVMSIICISMFILTFGIYIKYNGIFSLEDIKKQGKFAKGKINIIFLIFCPCFGLGFRSLLDFSLISYKSFLIISLLLFSVILGIFFKFTSEYKNKKSSIGIIIFAALFFAPSAVVQVNYVFDRSKTVEVQSTISSMRISKGSKSPDEYLIQVYVSYEKKMELKVSKEYYETLSVGEVVNIGEKAGFLDIPYAFVMEK